MLNFLAVEVMGIAFQVMSIFFEKSYAKHLLLDNISLKIHRFRANISKIRLTDRPQPLKGVMMYRIRPGCDACAQMNIPADQARRMIYIGEMNCVPETDHSEITAPLEL